MSVLRRLTLVAFVAALCASIAYGAGALVRDGQLPWAEAAEGPTLAAEEPNPDDPAGGAADPDAVPPADTPDPTPEPEPTPKPEPELKPGPALLSPGDEGDDVRDLQARLAQIDWFDADVTGYYGDVTEEAVRGFQAKREIPVTGEVDRRTLDRLHGMTTEPTEAELSGTASGNVPGPLDPRCETGRALCVDKSTNTLRWVVDGEVLKLVDVRFGGELTPTREGAFSVTYKSRDHVSSLYDTPMPFAMFFSDGQAVHYSADFAAVGYAGASHGCVNVRDYDAVAWLFDQVAVGDKVIVYWS
ncbi:peptidoglycan hydrolase-like protein with peptidoglycan-binding domain [Nocardioides thalensis]|uniref:Peptidoglycan hydrolase-like protein with peptidoglycan-binding domain n=1 Tax=Nocardioides thalensis TaxID=1914755 RepID=A0A853BZH9_9ACTN|nr:L,D-transpeptidase family protein [Nocardioides thalensis]NYI99542.1 peptidoglycan hydrolase-like protein with peptidoglycan-binding domain [Nocardioides thalensis]